MDKAYKKEMMVWTDTATMSQLQSKLLDLTTALDVVFTEPDVIADAKYLVRIIHAEIAVRHQLDNIPEAINVACA